MDVNGRGCSSATQSEEEMDLRRGPWTVEEDFILMNYIANHGEGRWNSLARCAVQKHAKQLKCDVNSKQFKDTMRYQWMPRLVERIQVAAAAAANSSGTTTHRMNNNQDKATNQVLPTGTKNDFGGAQLNPSFTPENSSTGASSDSVGTQVSPVTDLIDYYSFQTNNHTESSQSGQLSYPDSLTSPSGYFNHGLDFQAIEQNNMWFGGGDVTDNFWNVDDGWFLQ
ncbi:hypothetical protein HHK36_020931 [Tetracentron sinense]|uniref:Uncharacterized protein n=1 Tax=Tetracentron sinense TaxID=13715 RepID=A0A835DC28_TETSI|nr:hypothetical protein HHK36_020931 [Tetracentron sinense]